MFYFLGDLGDNPLDCPSKRASRRGVECPIVNPPPSPLQLAVITELCGTSQQNGGALYWSRPGRTPTRVRCTLGCLPRRRSIRCVAMVFVCACRPLPRGLPAQPLALPRPRQLGPWQRHARQGHQLRHLMDRGRRLPTRLQQPFAGECSLSAGTACSHTDVNDEKFAMH